jgi:hypothetical protein
MTSSTSLRLCCIERLHLKGHTAARTVCTVSLSVESGRMCAGSSQGLPRVVTVVLPWSAPLSRTLRCRSRPNGGSWRGTGPAKHPAAARRRAASGRPCRPWTIAAKEDSRIIGWGGLSNDPFDPSWVGEVGYSFHPSAWGKGYGSELASACMDMADRVLALPEGRLSPAQRMRLPDGYRRMPALRSSSIFQLWRDCCSGECDSPSDRRWCRDREFRGLWSLMTRPM